MGYSLNTFPLVLSIKSDGSLQATVRNVEDFLKGTASRTATAFETAGKKADSAFNFSRTRREIEQIGKQIDALTEKRVTKSFDFFGIRSAQSGLANSPLQKQLNQQAAAENSLEAQRQRAHQQRMADIQTEFDAAMRSIRERQAAQAAAFAAAEAEGNRLLELDRQRIADSARMVAGPQFIQAPVFNPAGMEQAAIAAENFAKAQRDLATASNLAANAADGATPEQRALALTMSNAADEAENEAVRLRALATAQANVATAANGAGLNIAAAANRVTDSVRGQRFATIQASQQFQDFFIQIQGGTSPLIAFSQQASQLAFVMSGVGGATGKFAQFMAGGWGTAIFAGISVLSILTSKLFENADASDKARGATQDFGKAIDFTKLSVQQLSDAMRQLKDETDAAILSQDTLLDRRKSNAALAVGELNQRLAQTRRELDDINNRIGKTGGSVSDNLVPGRLLERQRQQELQRQVASLQGDIDGAQLVQTNLQIAASQRRVREEVEPLAKAQREYNSAVEQLIAKRKNIGPTGVPLNPDLPTLSQSQFDKQLDVLSKQFEARKKKINDAKDAEARARSEAQAGVRRANAEAIADGKVIGSAADAVAEANARYSAEILRIRNQLSSGAIDRNTARQLAADARQIQIAAVDAAQGMNKLGESLTKDFQDFDGESRFVDRIQKALSDLTQLNAELAKVNGVGAVDIGGISFDQADADRLKGNLTNSWVEPIRAANRALEDQAQLDQLILAGRTDEADFLREKQKLLESYGQLTDEERAKVEAVLGPLDKQFEILRENLKLEHERSREMDLQRQKIDAQVQAARSYQQAFEDLLSGGKPKDFLKAITAARKQELAKKLSIEIFGDLGKDTEDALTRSADYLTQAATDSRDAFKAASSDFETKFKSVVDALLGSAKAIDAAAGKLGGSGSGNPTVAQAATTPSAFGLSSGSGSATAVDGLYGTQGIPGIVGRTKPLDTVLRQQLEIQVQQLSAIKKNPLAVGENTAAAIGFLGNAIGGKVAAAANSFNNIDSFVKLGQGIEKEIGGALGSTLGQAAAGIGYGLFSDSIVKALGIKGSATGGAIGGALGSIIGGPLGGLIGGALGSIIGGAFKKTPKAAVQLGTTAYGDLQYGDTVAKGKGKGTRLDAAIQSANAVFDALYKLSDVFGTGLAGNFNIGSIGSRNKKYTFDPSGENRTKGAGVLKFATAEEAVKAAIENAIDKGIITGIKASTKRLLTAGGDFDRALDKAVKFENVFKELKSYLDPVGAAIDELDIQFSELRRIFAEAGASTEEYSQLEQLYAIKRSEAVKNAAKDMTSTLQSLLDDLRYKSDFGLSLRTRESNATAAFAPLASQVRAGKAVDQQAFVDAAQAYLDISRQIYGSTATYFARLADVTALTSQAIVNAGGTVQQTTTAVQQAAQAAATATTTVTNAGGVTTAGATTSPVTAAANDNALATQTIIAAIERQTALLAIPGDRVAQFTAVQLEEAIRAAFNGTTVRAQTDGTIDFTTKPVVDSIQELKSAVTNKLDSVSSAFSNFRIISAPGTQPAAQAAPLLMLRNG